MTVTFVKSDTKETMNLTEIKPGTYKDGDCLITEIALNNMGWQRV